MIDAEMPTIIASDEQEETERKFWGNQRGLTLICSCALRRAGQPGFCEDTKQLLLEPQLDLATWKLDLRIDHLYWAGLEMFGLLRLNRPWQPTTALLLVLVAATLSTTSAQYINVVSFGVYVFDVIAIQKQIVGLQRPRK
jgi:hypothetical protein